jgi:ribosomal protein S18 acetylase RimI-like enzyme
MEIRPFAAADVPAVQALFQRIPEGDRTFFKEDVGDPDHVASWAGQPGRRLLAVDGERVLGYVAVLPLTGWSAHVGEIRLVVDPEARGRGLGRELARRALLDALELRLSKIFVEVVSTQVPAIGMFEGIGFQPEAVLRCHVQDGEGNAHDLIVLAHVVDDTWAGLATAGIDEAVGA